MTMNAVSTHRAWTLRAGLLLFWIGPLPPGMSGTEHEQASDDGVDGPAGEDGEEGDANSGGKWQRAPRKLQPRPAIPGKGGVWWP
jgi:hypothetical protein